MILKTLVLILEIWIVILIMKTLIMSMIEISLVLKALIKPVLILIHLISTVLQIRVLIHLIHLIKTGWSKKIVGTVAKKITVTLGLVTVTTHIVGSRSSIHILVSEATGGRTLIVRVRTTTSFTTVVNHINLILNWSLILKRLMHSEHRRGQIINLFRKVGNVGRRRRSSDRSR